MTLPLTPQVFTILNHLIQERTGLHYAAADADMLAQKITPRALERGFDSLLEYYYFLRYDEAAPAELDALIDALVVNETYFFREEDALRVIVDRVLPPIVRERGKARVWSAACATGEEPLTLAMLLDRAGTRAAVEIVASDISEAALARARRGTFWGRSLRALPDWARAAYMRADGPEAVHVRDDLLAAVAWHRVNLLDAAAVAALGTFDVILCRNVLIYFEDDTTARVIETLARALRPGGLLAVGASESLLRFGTLLECEEHAGAFFYRRQADG